MRLLIITQKVDSEDPVLGFFHRWIAEFSKNVDSLIVICLYKGHSNLPANVKVFSLGKENGSGRLSYLLNFKKILWQQRNEYDAVFVHMNQIYMVLAGIWWKLTGKKTALWYTHRQVSLSLKMAVMLADKIFTASKESFRIPSPKVMPMGHGIDTDAFSPSSAKNEAKKASQKFNIITVGRISPVKGYDTMLDAMNILKQKGIDFHFTVIGGPATPADEEYYKKLLERVSSSALSGNVAFVGPVSNTATIPYLQSSDIFINMSGTGGLDKAVLEAMAVGLPVVTCNETFESTLGQYGLMVKPGDAEGLVKVLETMYNDSVKASQTGLALRDIVVNTHNLENLIKRIVKAY